MTRLHPDLQTRLAALRAEGTERFGAPDDAIWVWVDPSGQRLVSTVGVFSVSTSARGLGNVEGSLRTPTGWHRVAARMGEAAEPGERFVSRESVGWVPGPWRNEGESEDMILTRILRLAGLEPGVNEGSRADGVCVDSWERMIYLHGTNQEHMLGRPASHGCVRMANVDIIAFETACSGREIFVFIGAVPMGYGERPPQL